MLLPFFRKKNMIKLQCPEGGTGASFDGKEYKADKNGVIKIPAEASPDLIRFHKFTVFIGAVEPEDAIPPEDVIEIASETPIEEDIVLEEGVIEEAAEITAEPAPEEKIEDQTSNKKPASNKKNK